MFQRNRLHSPMLPGATSRKAEDVFSGRNTQHLPASMGRGLPVRVCLFYMHTHVLIMHMCVYLYTHTRAIQILSAAGLTESAQ